jgi:hypothetical protein
VKAQIVKELDSKFRKKDWCRARATPLDPRKKDEKPARTSKSHVGALEPK